jgi:predicted aspartyl protease
MPQQSSAFTLEFKGISHVLRTEISVSIAFDPLRQTTHPEFKKFFAIWDTGATNTVISDKVVKKCGLKPISMAKVYTASEKDGVLCNVYLVNIIIPNKIGFSQVRVTEGSLFGDCDLLIGMDIITTGDFSLTNKDSKTMFSFRWPSLERVDYTKKVSSASKSPPVVGRNEPCPCGSGKKYKKCCA